MDDERSSERCAPLTGMGEHGRVVGMHDHPMLPAAVLFDLDGTLIDTVELIVRSFQHATAHHLGVALDRAAIVATIGRPLLECLEEIAPGRAVDLYATYRDYNRAQHDVLARPIAGVHAVLETLWRRGYRLGVVTSKSRAGAEQAIRCCALPHLLEVIVCLEDTVRHKPAPDPLLFAVERLGVRPDEALYVGDSVFDVGSAQAAGMPVAAVLWGAGVEAELVALQPRYVLRDPADLLVLLPSTKALSALEQESEGSYGGHAQ